MTKKYPIASHLLAAAFLISFVLLLFPLLQKGFYISDDGEWMVIRLSAFYQSLAEGQFPVRYLGRLNHSYGYPVANFLYPGFLYIGSLFHGIGFSFVDSVKLIIAGAVAGSSVFFYFWLTRHFGSLASLAGSLSFIFGPYLAFDIYKRGSVGEILAFLPVAISLWAIDRGFMYILPPVLAFLLISHNSLAVMFLLFLLVYSFLRKPERTPQVFSLGFAMATFFWLPALWERRYVLFDSVVISDPSDFFVLGERLGLIGFVSIASFVLLIGKKRPHLSQIHRYFMGVFAVSVVLATPLSALFWSMRIPGMLFQFPFRLLALALVSQVWLVASAVETSKLPQKLFFIFLTLMVFQLFPVIGTVQNVVRDEGYYTTNEATTTVSNEYMPRWVEKVPMTRENTRLIFIEGRGEIEIHETTTQKIQAGVHAFSPSIMQINTIYYPGWGVKVDGQPVPVSYQNSFGLIRFAVPSGFHRIESSFHETAFRLFADVLSVTAAGLYVFLAAKRRLS